MEVKIRFPIHGVMNALRIVYPQYWLQQDCDAFFANHLQVFKIAFCCGKTIRKVDEQEVQMHKLLYATNFDYHQGMFKLTMKSNAATCMVPTFDTNPLTRIVTTSWILVFSFPEYVKLAKLAMIQIICSVEDEKCFSTLAFLNSKLCVSFEFIKATSFLFISQLLCACLHNNFTLWRISRMLNVLSSGKQHDITTTLMVKVQCFCGVAGNVSTIAKSFVVCQVAGYLYVEAKKNWPFTMCYYVCWI